MRLLILILTGTLAANTCTTSSTGVQTIRDREWKLVWVEEFPSMPTGVATPTIRFGADGHLGGNTGCNSAGASYTAEGDRLTIQPMITTKRACLDPRGNALERAYLGAVERTRRFRTADGTLELLDEGGRVLARFQ